jgi:hypothetical protein
MSEEEMLAVKNAFRQEMTTRQAETKLTEKNKKEGQILADNKKKKGEPQRVAVQGDYRGHRQVAEATDTVTALPRDIIDGSGLTVRINADSRQLFGQRRHTGVTEALQLERGGKVDCSLSLLVLPMVRRGLGVLSAPMRPDLEWS